MDFSFLENEDLTIEEARESLAPIVIEVGKLEGTIEQLNSEITKLKETNLSLYSQITKPSEENKEDEDEETEITIKDIFEEE